METKNSGVRAGVPRAVGWGAAVLFGACAIGSLISGEFQVTPIFLLFAALGIMLLVTTGELSLDDEGMSYSTARGTYRMRWDEVESIEEDPQQYTLIFHSRERGRRLSVFGPSFWGGPEGAGAQKVLLAQVQNRHIPVRQTMRAQFMLWGGKKIEPSRS